MNDDDLRTLLRDAVSDVHPEPALEAIRGRTREVPGVRRLPPVLAVALAAATVAVIVGGITLASQRHGSPSQVASGPPSASGSSSSSSSPGLVSRTLAVYFVGDTSQGPRLYREFHRVSLPTTGDATLAAVDRALRSSDDPDYRSPWPRGSVVDATVSSSRGPVELSLRNDATDLTRRPAGMSDAEAETAVQQLVYTAQAAVGERRPVTFQVETKAVRSLLGVDVSAPVGNDPPLDVLSLVSISDPAEGTVVGSSFVANGVASSFEANVPWEIRQGDVVVKQGFATADGWLDKLYPWQTDPIDVSDLEPGRYTFAASTDDPSDGEGPGPTTDTRTIVVRR